MCQVSRTTLGALKKVKFRLSRNLTKFDVVARFRETIPTVKPVSSSEIKKIQILTEFYHSTIFQKFGFSGVSHAKKSIFRTRTLFLKTKHLTKIIFTCQEEITSCLMKCGRELLLLGMLLFHLGLTLSCPFFIFETMVADCMAHP